MPTTTETRVNDLIINKMSRAQFDALQEKSPTELYIVEGDSNAIYAEQITALPTAAEGNLGKVYQYIGATDANYTQNYFYKCVSSGNPAVYSWQQVNVQPAVDPLPSQSGQSGKFLTTDGTDASWSDKPLVNKATGTNSVCTDINTTYIRSTQFGSSAIINGNFATGVGFDTRAGLGGTAIGAEAYATTGKNVGYGTAIGKSAHANGNASIAIGSWASANGKHSIQLGGAGGIYNYDDNTMNVCLGESLTQNYKLLLSDGTIPEARLADTTNAQQGDVLTLDSNGNAVWQAGGGGSGIVATTGSLLVANWDPTTHSQTITVTELTATKNVLVSPAPASTADYIAGGIICSGQLNNTLTFTCTTTPSADITVNMMIFD